MCERRALHDDRYVHITTGELEFCGILVKI